MDIQSFIGRAPRHIYVIPTRDLVLLPESTISLTIRDLALIAALKESAKETETPLACVVAMQEDDPHTPFSIGTVGQVIRMIELPDTSMKVVIHGIVRARITALFAQSSPWNADIDYIPHDEPNDETLAIIQEIRDTVDELAPRGFLPSPDFHLTLRQLKEPGRIVEYFLSYATLSISQRQELLECDEYGDILHLLFDHIVEQIELQSLQEEIRTSARNSMNSAQKEYYLREQLKAIKQALGEDEDLEIDELRQKLAALTLESETKEEITKHINRLERLASDSMEAAVLRQYIELVLALPWNTCSEDVLDLQRAQEILDAEHYGMKRVKDRILDYLSVKFLKQDGHTPILCLVGPPGTGKTSLGASIAKALNREYARIALGGISDECELRGHRRTYVGAMPGRFIQAIKRVGTCNPLIVIDELDKIGASYKGDPSAVLLEVLDPQQNKAFYDNYIGMPFDLSKVFFIATANSLENISGPLRDRMEIIEIDGYTHKEKFHIAQNYIIPRSLESVGLANGSGSVIPENLLNSIISDYSRESGVRDLQKCIYRLCSKAARSAVEKRPMQEFSIDQLPSILGPRRYIDDPHIEHHAVGISHGLAWTSHGGQMLKVEAVVLPGNGRLLMTGQLGEVMKESGQAAQSFARNAARSYGIDPDIFQKNDLHIHVPANGIPKDGPSAGITICTALMSALTNRPVSRDYAMTGEINLHGDILPVGGIKEKILAAHRMGVRNVFIPLRNREDALEHDELFEEMNIHFVSHAGEVLDVVLLT